MAGKHQVTDSVWIEPELGLGYRDYYDFTGSPSRNEWVSRIGLQASRQMTARIQLALTFNYDRFSSENELFDTDRFLGGIVTRWTYEFLMEACDRDSPNPLPANIRLGRHPLMMSNRW